MKKKSKQEYPTSPMAERILRLHRKWADEAQRQSERLSRKGKITMLALFIAAGMAGSILCFSKVLQSSAFAFRIGTIRSPVVETDTFKRKPTIPASIKNRFQFFMDSLARSPGGSNLQDSLLRKYPGLLDSIALIERLETDNKPGNK